MVGFSNQLRLAALLAMSAGGLAMSAPALADVLQVNADGDAQWISGPSAQTLAGGPQGAVGDVPVEVDAGMLMPQAITEASGAAGPARWRARVAELAAKYDISPSLLEAVVWQESRWNEGALSPVGARGLTQLMPGTAAQMGVNASDPAANLEGGARYLRQQLDLFDGDIEKALAAYNAGPGRVIRAGGVPAIRETQGYVAAIMTRLSDPVRR